ncbi:lytic transglycosylase domain-containing protein [Streptomyces sp. NPDC056464]|uniref:lytic transglycosylase domain-containing protein n=1 Tax=Streptomyces sp. NPDC056464 TaxID=3345828 RepID=UPI00369EE495
MGTAAAVAAMVALTASQAPTAIPAPTSAPAPAGPGPSVSGDTPYRTDLPPLRAGKRNGDAAPAEVGAALSASVFAAYRRAEERLSHETPGCRLLWQLLAAIGQVESGQARGGRVTSDGTTVTPILGPRLDGVAFAQIRDTDGGIHDGDTEYDRAVGPMQFIASTWARWGADGNGDGRADPNNVFDAALAAGRYLCAGGRDLSDPAQLDRAILGYNHSTAYLRTVRAWYGYFLDGHRALQDSSAVASARPEPSPSPSNPDSRTPSPSPSATPSPTSPTPTTSHPAPDPRETEEPQLPLPAPDIELPADDLPPSADLLTSNSADSMTAAPSTTTDTRR